MVNLFKKKQAVTSPRYHTEILWSRIGNETTPIGFGVRDTETNQIVTMHPMDTPIAREMLPEAKFFRARSNQEKLSALVSLDQYGRMGSDRISAQDFTQKLLNTPPEYPSFESFKNNPEIALVPLRYKQNFGQKVEIEQGYALVDEKTGKILRHIPEQHMQVIFANMGCSRVRVGKRGTVTALDLADGNRISEKQFIDGLLGVTRPERARKISHTQVIAGAMVAGAIAFTGIDDGKASQSLSQEFNLAATASPQYQVKVVKRNPGVDAMASVHAIENKQLRRMMAKWFIDGDYKRLAGHLGNLSQKKIETDDKAEIAKLDIQIRETERRMIWPVEAARAADTMWKQDKKSMQALGFKSPAELLDHALATAEVESFFGEQMTMPLNPTVEGYYHFNDRTFLDTKSKYERSHGKLKGYARDRMSVLELRNDAYVSTLAFLQYTKEMQLGRSSTPSTFYRRHVLGPSAGKLESNPHASAASIMPLAAGDNPGLFDNQTAAGTLKKIDGRLAFAKGENRKRGFVLPREEDAIIYKGAIPEFGPAFNRAAAEMDVGGEEIRLTAGAMMSAYQNTGQVVAATFH